MENKETVLVTGGSGFIASHCIIQLAAAGYQVKATVRDLSRTNKLNQTLLNGVEKYEGKSDLSVDWQVTNLSSDEGWDEAMAGCDYVLHVASPIAMQLPKDEDEMVKPAVEGTLRVLKAASKAGVKRVVITSSVAAIMYGTDKQGVFHEEDWTDPKSKTTNVYAYTLAVLLFGSVQSSSLKTPCLSVPYIIAATEDVITTLLTPAFEAAFKTRSVPSTAGFTISSSSFGNCIAIGDATCKT